MYIAKRPKFLKVSILVMRLPQGTKTLNRGGYRVFQKGGLRPAIRNAGGKGGGGGVLSASGPIRKAGGRGGGGCCPFKARYEKRRGGGMLSGASGPIQNAGKEGGGGGGGGGGGCLADRRGGVTIYERGGCNPQTLPPRLDPPLLKKGSAFENRYALCCYEPEMTLKTRPAYKR